MATDGIRTDLTSTGDAAWTGRKTTVGADRFHNVLAILAVTCIAIIVVIPLDMTTRILTSLVVTLMLAVVVLLNRTEALEREIAELRRAVDGLSKHDGDTIVADDFVARR